MVVAPRHWLAQRRGNTLTFTAPSGERAGFIAYDERLRPLGSAIELVKADPPPSNFVPHRASPIEDVVTREGEYGAVVFRPKQVEQSQPDMKSSYAPMLREIVKFFQTKQPPVPNEETLELFAFMDAAQRSKEAGGKPVRLR